MEEITDPQKLLALGQVALLIWNSGVLWKIGAFLKSYGALEQQVKTNTEDIGKLESRMERLRR